MDLFRWLKKYSVLWGEKCSYQDIIFCKHYLACSFQVEQDASASSWGNATLHEWHEGFKNYFWNKVCNSEPSTQIASRYHYSIWERWARHTSKYVIKH